MTRPAISWPALVPLSRDHDDVAGLGGLDRAADRRAPVELDFRLAAPSLQAPASAIAAGSSLRGLSEVTIGTSESSPRCGPSADACRVAVAARSEDTDTRPVVELARGAEDVLERARLVRVVDHDREGLSLVDRLEPAGDARHGGDPGRDRVVRQFEQLSGGDDAQDVLDVEAAAEAGADRDPGGGEVVRAGVLSRSVAADVRVVREPERQQRGAGRPELLGEPSTVLVADVDGRGRRSSPQEQPPLGVEVVLHRRVEVEVVLAQVREDERREPDPVEAPERRAVRGRLHGAAPVPGVEHLAEEPLEVDRLGGRAGRRPALAVDAGLDRSEQPGPAPRRGEHGVKRKAVVVFPLVPVTPATCSSSVGRPKNSSAATAIAARESATTSCGTARSSGRSTTSATAPFATASGAKSCPSARRPGTQKKSAPGATARAS